MYAIVKNKDGTHYTSVVFGYFCQVTASDSYEKYLESIHNQFYLVLNEKKDRMIKKYVFPSENKYLDPQILIVDADQQDWILDADQHGCVRFLDGTDFYAAEIVLDASTLKKCIAMDAMQHYSEIVSVKNETDIENLYCVSGYFHDAYIQEYNRIGDTVYVLLDGVWGCKIELWFEGDTDFCVNSRNPAYEDPSWYEATVLMEDGYFYLIDEGAMKTNEITNQHSWFRGRHLKYHILPNTQLSPAMRPK